MDNHHLPPHQLSSDSTLSGWTLYPEQAFAFDYAGSSGGSYLAPHHVNSEQHAYQPEVFPPLVISGNRTDNLLPPLGSKYNTNIVKTPTMYPHKLRLPLNSRTSPLPTRRFRTGRRHRYQPQILCRRRLRWNPLITSPPSGIMATMICPRLNSIITRLLSTNSSQCPMAILLGLIVRQATPTPTYRLRPPSRRQAQ